MSHQVITRKSLFIISLYAWPCQTCTARYRAIKESKLKCSFCGHTFQTRVTGMRKLDRMLISANKVTGCGRTPHIPMP